MQQSTETWTFVQLNFQLRRGKPDTYKIEVIIRASGHSLKSTVRSIIECVEGRRAAETKVGMDEEKTAETALDEYRQTLFNTFGGSEQINDIMEEVRYRIYGGWVTVGQWELSHSDVW